MIKHCVHDKCVVIYDDRDLNACPYCFPLGKECSKQKDILPKVGQRYACNTGAIYKVLCHFAVKNEFLAVNERTETPVVFDDKGENHMFGEVIKLVRKV